MRNNQAKKIKKNIGNFDKSELNIATKCLIYKNIHSMLKNCAESDNEDVRSVKFAN